MNYGMRLLAHVFDQVRGNLRQAAALTLGPYLGMLLIGGYAAYRFAGFLAVPNQIAFPLVPLLLAILFFAVFFAWAAVGWHRYVLLEEPASGFATPWDSGRIWGYIWRLVVIFIVIGAAFAFLLGFVGGALGGEPGSAIMTALGLGLNLLASWMFVRMGLILPAAAVDQTLKIRESWSATSEISGEILIPIIAISLGFGLAQGVVMGLIGGLPGLALLVCLVWVQMLANLALLSTLFGNRIEGRALN